MGICIFQAVLLIIQSGLLGFQIGCRGYLLLHVFILMVLLCTGSFSLWCFLDNLHDWIDDYDALCGDSDPNRPAFLPLTLAIAARSQEKAIEKERANAPSPKDQKSSAPLPGGSAAVHTVKGDRAQEQSHHGSLYPRDKQTRAEADEAEQVVLRLIGTVSYTYESGTDWVMDGFNLPLELLPELENLKRRANALISSSDRLLVNKRVALDLL